jgi:hypothetical protein
MLGTWGIAWFTVPTTKVWHSIILEKGKSEKNEKEKKIARKIEKSKYQPLFHTIDLTLFTRIIKCIVK